MTFALRVVLLGAAFAAATVAFGWGGVPVAAAAWAVLARGERGAAVAAGLAGMVAWGAVLGLTAARGPVGPLAIILGGVLQVRPVGVYVLTLAFPGLLALTAALLARSLASLAQRDSQSSSQTPGIH